MQGRVNFGAREIKGRIVPIISITDEETKTEIEFVCVTHAMPDWDMARTFISGVFKAITGPQNNFAYSRNGGVDGSDEVPK